MNIRTTRSRVTFASPFVIHGVDGEQRPGSYDVETEEEVIEGKLHTVYLRVATILYVATLGVTRSCAVHPDDLAAHRRRVLDAAAPYVTSGHQQVRSVALALLKRLAGQGLGPEAESCAVVALDPETLLAAVRAVAKGKNYIDPSIGRQLLESAASDAALTRRELDVLRHIARGLSNKEIAAALAVGEETVKTHVGHLLAKLRVENRAQAIVQAIKRGLVSLDELR